MNAHETLAEFVFQGLQGFVQQHLAAFMAQGHVLVVGDKEDHMFQRDQLNAFARARTDMAARAAGVIQGRTGQRRQLHAIGPLGLLQRRRQAFRAHRFNQIAHRADLKGFQGKLVMGGAEDHRRRRLALAQLGRHLQAIEAGHADIQQHHVGFQAVDQRQRLFTIAGTGLQYTTTFQLPDHAAKPFTGQGFVINDQDIHIARASCMSLAHG